MNLKRERETMNIEIKASYNDNFNGIEINFSMSHVEIPRDDYYLFGVEPKNDTDEAWIEADKAMILKISRLIAQGTTFLGDN
jgi:hypothetical protein